ELLVIAVVALIVIGPKELPSVLRTVGQWTTKIRRMAGEFQSQFQEAMREAEMADLKKHADDLNKAAQSLTKPLDPADYLGKLDEPQPSPPTSTGIPVTKVESAPLAEPANSPATQAPEPSAPASEPAAAAPASSEPAGGGGRSA
ncbi:MAG: twin-arginine translocase subunit TatB, partial [Xanthobacteraceae bacterium]|nr:twin-arginine translocase subunit TatB [Xanthobacteraceae bacterium]